MKFRLSVESMLDNGADPKGIRIDALVTELDLGRAWTMYRSLTRVRVSQAKSMGVGFTDDSFIDEVVTLWDSIKKCRNRPLGLATGNHAKRVCMPNVTAEADGGEPDVLLEVEGESLPNLDVWVHRVAQMRVRENLAAYFGDCSEESDFSGEESDD